MRGPGFRADALIRATKLQKSEEKTVNKYLLAGAVAALALAAGVAGASAEDTLKLAVGQRGNWDTSISEVGQLAGIFKKHGLVLEIVYTSGAGETQQAVISGSVDIGVAAGVMGVFGAFSKGAPVRVIGAETTGANDLYWYVRVDSPIKSLKDTDGKTLGYSTNGSSTHGIVTAFMHEYHLKAIPTSVGSPSASLTAVMSGQIDVGWAAPPFGLDQLDAKQIRVIATGNDAAAFKGQTVRLNIANTQSLATKKDAIDLYMKAYRETVDYLYGDPNALKVYADWLKISEEKAKRTRDGFFPKESVNPDKIVGLDVIVHDAVTLKFTAAELTQAQLAELIQIPPR
jgi:NitT/TauT family transport system substrate-binding protein